MAFNLSEYFPRRLYDQITETRIGKSDLIANSAERRSKPENISYDGKLTLLAADHPARGVTAAGGDPLAMGDRYELLGRILRVLSSEFDGVVATVDVIEDLLILDQLLVDAGQDSVLDDALLVASLNRSGLRGSAWELDDRLSSFSIDGIARLRLDGVKFLLRLDPTNRDSNEALELCARVIEEVDRNGQGMPFFLEALPVRKGEGGYETVRDAAVLAQVVGVASALGSTSANTWLKVPYVDGFARVAGATTLPVLMLGGEPQDNALPLLEAFAAGMRAAPNVRGTIAGRNVLFPPNGDDPAALAHAVEVIVHEGMDAQAAYASMDEARGADADWLSKAFAS